MGDWLSKRDEALLKWAREHPDDPAAIGALEGRVSHGGPMSTSSAMGGLLLFTGIPAVLAVLAALDRNVDGVIGAIVVGAILAASFYRHQRQEESGVAACRTELMARKRRAMKE